MSYEEWRRNYRNCGCCANWDSKNQKRMTLYPGYADNVADCSARKPNKTTASQGSDCMTFVPNNMSEAAKSCLKD
jgi:hypothetical protein